MSAARISFLKQGTFSKSAQGTSAFFGSNQALSAWCEAFLDACKAANLSKGTLRFYRIKLEKWVAWCYENEVYKVEDLTTVNVRAFLSHLQDTETDQGSERKPGGVHAHYRAMKAFLYWWENEVEPQDWQNPIRKVRQPKVPFERQEPIDMDVLVKLAETCEKGTFLGDRDKAILLCLLDTGARAQEFLDLNIGDINPTNGAVVIQQGKGRKPRTTFLGSTSKRALRSYLRHRDDNLNALWLREDRAGRLSYSGLRQMMYKRSSLAGVEKPQLHAFRRGFATNMNRGGTDVYTLAELMGHKGITVLKRYLGINEDDLKNAHNQSGPVDKFLK